MRKYYIEVESYRDNTLIIGIKIIDQATKNRRSKFAKTLENVKLDFFLVEVNAFRQRLADPPSMIRENVLLRENCKALEIKLKEVLCTKIIK